MRPIKYQLSEILLDPAEDEKPTGVFQINTPKIDIRRAMQKVETAIAVKEKKGNPDDYNLVEMVKPKVTLFQEYLNFLQPKKIRLDKSPFGTKVHENGIEKVAQKTFTFNFKPDGAPLLYNYTPKADLPAFFFPRSILKDNDSRRNSDNKIPQMSRTNTSYGMRHSGSSKMLNNTSKKKIRITFENESSMSKTQGSLFRPNTRNDNSNTSTNSQTKKKMILSPVYDNRLPQLLGFKKESKKSDEKK